MADMLYKLHGSNPFNVFSGNDLDGLAANSGKKSTAVIPNTSDGYLYGYFACEITFAAAVSAGGMLELWIAQRIDGTPTYEDFTDGASPVTGQYLAHTFITRAASTLKQASPLIALPPYDFYVMLVNKASQNFHASTDSLLRLFKVTPQTV